MLVLASNSPRRRLLLELAGWQFRVSPVQYDERTISGEKPVDYVLRLAEGKARALLENWQGEPGAIVLAADTAVVDGDAILGKPADAREAEAMLRRLRGRVHQVYTGLAALRLEDGFLLRQACVTDVPMRMYSDQEMFEYIATGDPMDKAGAYAIQHSGFHPVQDLLGCYANVMGLPVCHLSQMLDQMGHSSQKRVWEACQEAVGYPCQVYRQALQS